MELWKINKNIFFLICKSLVGLLAEEIDVGRRISKLAFACGIDGATKKKGKCTTRKMMGIMALQKVLGRTWPDEFYK